MNEPTFNLFAELIKAPRPHVTVDFPRNDKDGNPLCKIALVVLNNNESLDAKATAHREVMRRLKDDSNKVPPGFESLYEDILAIELLFRAARNPEDIGMRFFPKETSLGLLSNDELGVLVNHYNMLVATSGPVIVNMTEDEMESYISKITEAGATGSFFLNSLSLDELKAFGTYMAHRLYKQRTDNASPGSPLDDTSKKSEAK